MKAKFSQGLLCLPALIIHSLAHFPDMFHFFACKLMSVNVINTLENRGLKISSGTNQSENKEEKVSSPARMRLCLA